MRTDIVMFPGLGVVIRRASEYVNYTKAASVGTNFKKTQNHDQKWPICSRKQETQVIENNTLLLQEMKGILSN